MRSNITGEDGSPVNTLLTVLTSVNTDYCVNGTRETRTVGFRVPAIAQLLYSTVLDHQDKETLKLLVEGAIYALAKQKLGSVPCESVVSRRLASVATIVSGQGTVVFNLNLSVSEAKAHVNINVDLKVLEDTIRLLEYLYDEASKNWSPQTRRIIGQRVARAKRTLEELLVNIN